ncbi:MAG: RusA family crossover junction endodeoxyribonuclease [Bacteroidia bacterium]|nr:RusA family crossover junction endodeoxyribonuclease [Bacteroidia bacterium]
MEETKDFANNLRKQLRSDTPDFDIIKSLVLTEFNKHNSKDFSLEDELSSEEQVEVVRWINKVSFGEHFPVLSRIFTKKECVSVPFFSPSLSQKLMVLGQFHCPICKPDEGIVSTLPIRISAISKQAAGKVKREAFENAISDYLKRMGINEPLDSKLCVLLFFVLGKSNKDKDLDNMSKALMDALEGTLFTNDSNVDHLNLIKTNHEGEEDFCIVNIRKSTLNEHKDVLFKEMTHSWAGQPFIDLEDFIE